MIQFDKVTAVYRPLRIDDLRPGVAEWIGHSFEWEAMWVIEDGPYEGQWAMGMDRLGLRDRGEEVPPFYWCPLCDLEVIG